MDGGSDRPGASGDKKFGDLRERAREIMERNNQSGPPDEVGRLKADIEELGVYQIELELQNDELREVHGRLEASQKYLNDLFTYSPVGYLVLESDGVIRDLNRAAAGYFGISRNALIGQRLQGFIPYDAIVPFRACFDNLWNSRVSQCAEVRFRVREGADFYARMDLLLLKDGGAEGGETVLCSLMDVTERRRTEDELRRLNEELELRARELTREIQERRRAERAFREKQAQLIHAGRLSSLGEMATGVAHEMNQPLSIISMQCQVLRRAARSLDDPRLAEGLEVIREQVDRASNIIDNMRGYARLDVAVEDCHLPDLLERSLVFFREQFREHRIRLHTEVADRLPPVRLNPQHFEQIVVNFLSNARHALNRREADVGAGFGKSVVLRLYAERDPNRVVFETIDNGAGMTEEERSRCLEPFFTTKPPGQGTGLGLSIVHGIVTSLRGVLEIDSRKGLGATLRVKLPCPAGGATRDTRSIG
jgi:PAS domain S-box-containing protein